jgi:hypothetical protein
MPVALAAADVDRSRVADLISAGAIDDRVALIANQTDPGPACVGDCDDNRRVDIDEVVRAVNIALGRLAVADCMNADPDGSASVAINEWVRAVANALGGCAAPSAG